MGFRLSVRCKDNEDVSFYGTKLYGYVHDETKLYSWKYLKGLGKLDENIWLDGITDDIELSEKEFSVFVLYYAKDLRDKYRDAIDFIKSVRPLLKEPGNKIISWV